MEIKERESPRTMEVMLQARTHVEECNARLQVIPIHEKARRKELIEEVREVLGLLSLEY